MKLSWEDKKKVQFEKKFDSIADLMEFKQELTKFKKAFKIKVEAR